MGGVASCCTDDDKTSKIKPVGIQKIASKDKDKPIQEESVIVMDNMNDKGEMVGLNEENLQVYLDKKTKINKRYTINDFRIQGTLGEGGFGIVHLAELKQNIQKNITEKYAIKVVSKQLLKKKKVYKNAIDEKNILAMYKCKFIVSLVMSFQSPSSIYFVMEYASGGDTYSLIKKKSLKLEDYKALGEAAVRFIAGCVILGLQFLHQNNYMYRDLKPENVLIFSNGYVKLTDFGLAKKSLEGDLSKTVSGTPFYYAPEMVMKKGYGKQIDLWTLGVYLYELSVYQPPFTTEQLQRNRFIATCRESESNRNWKGAKLSDSLKNLIDNLLREDRKKRLGAGGWHQLKNHAFFEGFDWKALEECKMPSPLRDIAKKYSTVPKTYKPPAQTDKTIENDNVQGFTYTQPQRMM